jgi:hypothetical protein
MITGRQLLAGHRRQINTHLEEGEWGKVPLAREQRKLAAIVAADVVGYSWLMGATRAAQSRVCERMRWRRAEPSSHIQDYAEAGFTAHHPIIGRLCLSTRHELKSRTRCQFP